MDEPAPITEKPPLPPPATSLAARLLNVFATPGEVFEEVQAARPATANWLVPAILAVIVGVAAVLIQFAQPAFVQHFRDQAAGTYDGMVKAGKMSQAEADKFVGIIEKVAQPAGCVAVVAGSFARVFWWALVLWLLALIFWKKKFSYLKAVEVAGLASMISVLGSVVALLLTVNFGKESAPSLALAVPDFNPKNPVHLALAAANVFDFWILGVMATGLARLARVPFARAFFLVVGYWLALLVFLISLGTLIGRLGGMK